MVWSMFERLQVFGTKKKKERFEELFVVLSFVSVAWDQSDKFVKIYLDLKGVDKIPAENVEVNFTER